MVDIDEADDELPLQVLKNMQAREQFIKGQIESIFVDKSIDWQEYMYIRRTRLEYGISDEEFEICARIRGVVAPELAALGDEAIQQYVFCVSERRR